MSDHIRDRIIAITSRIPSAFEEDADQILREFAVLHRSEETIEDLEGGVLSCGSGRAACVIRDGADPKVLRDFAANAIALAEYLEAEAVLAEAKRNKRRDELVSELYDGPGFRYTSIQPGARKAIDRIIQLEKKIEAAL